MAVPDEVVAVPKEVEVALDGSAEEALAGLLVFLAC